MGSLREIADEISCLLALGKNPEYNIAGKCASPLSGFLDPLQEIIVYSKKCYKNVHWLPCISQVQTTGPPLIFLGTTLHSSYPQHFNEVHVWLNRWLTGMTR